MPGNTPAQPEKPREPREAPPAASTCRGPGLDEHDQAERLALQEPGGYVVDLFAIFSERDRNDLIDV